MRFWIIALLALASVCWAAPPDNFKQTPAFTPATISAGYTEEMTYPYVPNRPLMDEESRFLATFPKWVGKFAIHEAVRQMLLAKEIHPNSLGYDPTGKDPARNALHYTEMYQSWWAPRAVKIPVRPGPPPLGELSVSETLAPTLSGVREITCPQGQAVSYDLTLPACRELEEVSVPPARAGLANPGLRLPTISTDRWSYTGAFGFWRADHKTTCPPKEPGPCEGPADPPADPPVPTDPGVWDPDYPAQPGDIGPHSWEPSP